MSKISIVIINDDACEYLDKMFLSLTEDLDLNTFEIIFIDNCSSDESVVKAQSYGVTQLFSFKKKVASRAELYNKGIELSSGEFIMYTHSDIYYDKDFFTKLIENDAINDATCGFINFAQYNSEGYFTDHEYISIDYENKKVYRKELFQLVPDESIALYFVSESCFMVRKEILQKLLFNTNYLTSYFEYEALDRILRCRYKVLKIAECKYTHYFIEMHEKINTDQQDSYYFLLNNNHLLEVRRLFGEITDLSKCIEEMKSNETCYTEEILSLRDEEKSLLEYKEQLLDDLGVLRKELKYKTETLNKIYSSKWWKLMQILYKIKGFIFKNSDRH